MNSVPKTLFRPSSMSSELTPLGPVLGDWPLQSKHCGAGLDYFVSPVQRSVSPQVPKSLFKHPPLPFPSSALGSKQKLPI